MMRRILVRGFHLFLIIALFMIPGLMSLDEEVQAKRDQVTVEEGLERLGDNRQEESNEMLQFVAGGHVLGFRTGDMFIASGDHALRVEFVGAWPVSPTDDGVSSNTENDRQAVQPLGRVTYRDLWDGVTLVYESHPSGVVKSTYTVQPSESSTANPADRIRLRYNVPVEVDESGHLVFSLETGQMREKGFFQVGSTAKNCDFDETEEFSIPHFGSIIKVD